MIIEITSSGGFAGLAAAGIDKRFDPSSQPPELAQTYCTAFDPEQLGKIAAESEGLEGIGADMITYRIVVTGEDGEPRVFELREDQLPPEMLDLIDEM